MFDVGSEGMIGRVLGNVSSILMIDYAEPALRGRVVGFHFDRRPACIGNIRDTAEVITPDGFWVLPGAFYRAGGITARYQ